MNAISSRALSSVTAPAPIVSELYNTKYTGDRKSASGFACPERPGLQNGDGLDLDQEFGSGERRDRDERVRRHLLAEEFFADRPVIGAMADVGQVGVDLDDIRHRAAAGLDLRLQALQGGARLRLEIAGMGGSAVPTVGDLAGDVEDRLRARDLDRLRIHRRVPDIAGSIGFDRGHRDTSREMREVSYFGDTTIVIWRPSMRGNCSTLAISSRSSLTRISTFMPSSWCANSRPRNRIVTLTLSPSSMNLFMLRILT